MPPHIRALWLGHTPEINQTTYTHASVADLAMVTSAIGDLQLCATNSRETGPENN